MAREVAPWWEDLGMLAACWALQAPGEVRKGRSESGELSCGCACLSLGQETSPRGTPPCGVSLGEGPVTCLAQLQREAGRYIPRVLLWIWAEC